MASLQRLAGVDTVSINGTIFNNTTVEWSPFTTTKEVLIGLGGVAGYKETYVTTKISVTLYDYSQLTVGDFPQTSADVQLVLANGKVIIMNSALVTGVVQVDSEVGTFRIEFEGVTLQEQTTSPITI